MVKSHSRAKKAFRMRSKHETRLFSPIFVCAATGFNPAILPYQCLFASYFFPETSCFLTGLFWNYSLNEPAQGISEADNFRIFEIGGVERALFRLAGFQKERAKRSGQKPA